MTGARRAQPQFEEREHGVVPRVRLYALAVAYFEMKTGLTLAFDGTAIESAVLA
jgi:hypothetical protein